MARAVPHNSNHAPTCPRPSSKTMHDNMDTAIRSFPSSSTVDECGLVFAIGIDSKTALRCEEAGRPGRPRPNLSA